MRGKDSVTKTLLKQIYIAARSRQLSIKDNIQDILCRMLIMSHTVIALKLPHPSCSVCGELGHTAQSLKHNKVSVLSEEQAKIES